MKVELVSVEPPLWRLQLIRILQLVGILAAFIGSADFLQLLAIVPPEIAKWLAISGPAFAAGIKPLVLLIGDVLDDGVRNNSFTILSILLLFGLLLTPSCAGLSLSVRSSHDDTTSVEGTVTYSFPKSNK